MTTLTAPTAGTDGAPSAAAGLPDWLVRHPVRAGGRRWYRIGKRCIDIAAGVVLALATLPLVLIAAALVKVTSPGGPAFYRQTRTGEDGKRFGVVKLRTMLPDADDRRDELAHLNTRTWPDFKIANDPRVTTVGRVLRATSIDELPQLWSIVSGGMSLVGPRPTSMPPERYADWQLARLSVPAGLTGLWQIVARDEPSFDDRVRLDIAYAQRCSLRLDLEILVRTVPAVLRIRSDR